MSLYLNALINKAYYKRDTRELPPALLPRLVELLDQPDVKDPRFDVMKTALQTARLEECKGDEVYHCVAWKDTRLLVPAVKGAHPLDIATRAFGVPGLIAAASRSALQGGDEPDDTLLVHVHRHHEAKANELLAQTNMVARLNMTNEPQLADDMLPFLSNLMADEIKARKGQKTADRVKEALKRGHMHQSPQSTAWSSQLHTGATAAAAGRM